jgi:hypothetical protein
MSGNVPWRAVSAHPALDDALDEAKTHASVYSLARSSGRIEQMKADYRDLKKAEAHMIRNYGRACLHCPEASAEKPCRHLIKRANRPKA